MTPEGGPPLPARPYPGLRPFNEDEWAIFFGREVHAAEAIARVKRHGMVMVHGSSGCGKSSLIRASVLPSLETDHDVDGRAWRTATMRPSQGPLGRLAEILGETLPPPPASADQPLGDPVGWDKLVLMGGGLVSVIEASLAANGGGSLCLLVDQFEEIFRWARERSDAEVRLFIEFLMQAAAPRDGGAPRLMIILTMRSDYLGQCAIYDGFAELLNERQYLLPKLDEFGLLRAIHEPATLYGGEVTSGAARQLLSAVSGELDALPVLQHALMRAYLDVRGTEERGAWVIDADALAAVGGARGALQLHAEEVFAAATGGRRDPETGEAGGGDPRLVEATEWMLRALTDIDVDLRAIRRPCCVSDLAAVSGVTREEAVAILDRFRAPDCNFIGPYLGEPLDDDTIVDIGHEALIRRWRRLSSEAIDPATNQKRGLIHKEFLDGLIWRTLVTQADAYASDHKAVLSPAAAHTRLEWYKGIEKRKEWTARYAPGRPGDRDRRLADEQWAKVAAFARASERNMRREEGIVGRLRTTRNGALVVLLLLCLVVADGIYQHMQLSRDISEAKIQAAAAKQKIAATDKTLLYLRDVWGATLVKQQCQNLTPPRGAPMSQYLDACTRILTDQLRLYTRTSTEPAPVGWARPMATTGAGAPLAAAHNGK
jgi:hypothetical protein